jgi:ribonuclease HI
MELLALIVALEQIKTYKYPIEVWTDSKYVVDSISKGWVMAWRLKNYKGKKNADLWERYLTVSKNYVITLHWIKGHNGHPENERCDELAVAAASNPENIDTEYENDGSQNESLQLF